MTKIFTLRGFARFQRKERLSDAMLCKAIVGIEAGLIDADLGGGLVKQRLPRTGQGKSGGYRTVIAIRRGDRAVFLYGFGKNERSNIDDDELEEFKRLAGGFLELTAQQIAMLIADEELMEVKNDEGA
ncbi:type II toxin-antitoxin system RelE/ParE family toxin [Rhodoblastus acidophilus]|uniref:type II toxin-antitoxin system RelE/ParE family toxin n=1 Tax=Rhodoblastus acidophilus TaxID=1074 RepID=UPI0022246060|nr:type II toxin-antitoxin system RelE/ParE family toxin [Rhodoblastus acidophilus]